MYAHHCTAYDTTIVEYSYCNTKLPLIRTRLLDIARCPIAFLVQIFQLQNLRPPDPRSTPCLKCVKKICPHHYHYYGIVQGVRKLSH